VFAVEMSQRCIMSSETDRQVNMKTCVPLSDHSVSLSLYDSHTEWSVWADHFMTRDHFTVT